MTQTICSNRTRKVLAQTCWFTALLNGLFAAHGADSLPQPPASPTRPTTPSNPLVPGNPGEDTSGKWSPNPLQYGPVDVHLSLYGGALYDDNIFTSDKHRESDFIMSISPRVSLGMGDYREQEGDLLLLEYTPSFIYYTDHSDFDTLNHAANVAGQVKSGKWQVNVSQSFLHLFDTDIDAGTLLGRNVYTTLFSAGYEISPKTSVELNARQSIHDINNPRSSANNIANSYNEWMVETFADYFATPKIKVGVGLSGGWLDNRRSVNSCYQQVLARVSYAVTEKVDLQARAGGQLQEFEEVNGTKQDNRLNGVFSVGVGYRPVEKTSIALSAYRQDLSSVVLIDEGYTVTGIDFNIRQAISPRITAGVSGGYSFTDYYGTAATVKSDRQDSYWRAQVSLDWRIVEQLSLSVFYQYRHDNSTRDQFKFSDHQVGLNLAYLF